MANLTDLWKKGTTVPSVDSLIEGGLAIDVAGKKAYSKGSDGTIFEIGKQTSVGEVGGKPYDETNVYFVGDVVTHIDSNLPGVLGSEVRTYTCIANTLNPAGEWDASLWNDLESGGLVDDWATKSIAPVLSGPDSVVENASIDITIDNYSATTEYTVVADNGTIIQNGPTITFTGNDITEQVESINGEIKIIALDIDSYISDIVYHDIKITNIKTCTVIRDVVYDNTNIATEFTVLNGTESSTGELVATGMDGYGIANVEQISKTKATPDMTSNTTPSGVCSASSIFDSEFEAWKAFDGSNAAEENAWESKLEAPQWLKYEFPSSKIIAKYAVTTFNHSTTEANPKNWTLQGSESGLFSGEEVILHTVTNHPSVRDKRTEFTFTNWAQFKYYRLHITETADTDIYTAIGELELYEQLITDTVTFIDNIESDFVLQNISANSTVDTLNTNVPIQDGDNLVIVKDDDSIHEMVASDVTGTYTMDTSSITQGEIPSRVFAQPKVAFDVGSGFVESALDGSTPVLNGANIDTHNTYASQEVSTIIVGSKIILRNIGDKMTVFTDTLKNCHY